MYYLYIDESGDLGRYLDLNSCAVQNSSKHFTLAGIIMDSQSTAAINCDIRRLSSLYFPPSIADAMNLHYHLFIQNAPPYNCFSDEYRLHLADGMFEIICNSPCTLLSVTTDLEAHFRRYGYLAAGPKAYAMLIMLERFQDSLTSKGSQDIVLYERFNKQEREKVEITMKMLKELLAFRHHVGPSSIICNTRNGDPLKTRIATR